MPYKKGQSGNPNGRPRGTSRNKQLLEMIGQEGYAAIVKNLVDQAKGGDTAAAGILLNRIVPPLKSVHLPVELNLQGTDFKSQTEEVLAMVSRGELAISEGATLLSSMASVRRVMPMSESDNVLHIVGGLPDIG